MIALLVGILLGFLAGLLPGINISFIMILSIPFLTGSDLQTVLLFYIAVMASSQYSGSISALLLGVPGETTSLPAVNIRKYIDISQIRQALYNSASGSLIGSILAILITIPLFYYFQNSTAYLTTLFLVIAGSVGLFLGIISSNNIWYVSTLMVVIGWLLSKIGFDSVTGTNFLTFGNPHLMGGLPFVSVAIALLVIPTLISFFFKRSDQVKQVNITNSTINYINSKDMIWPGIRGSIIGYVIGLIPYIGNAASSNVAYFVERWINKNNYMAQLTSSETANNSAYFSVLLPLLVFSVAIIPSETILLEIITTNGQMITWNTVEQMLPAIITAFVFINIICWILSYIFAGQVIQILKIPFKYLFTIIISLVLVVIWYTGQEITQGGYFLLVFLLLTPVGILLYKFDTTPLIFAFIMQNTMEPAILRLWTLYS
jgi:putative tricarboxylic transport membrane protein